MSHHAAILLVTGATVYLAVGLGFAIPFALRWAGSLDPVARSGTWGFRLLTLPGATLLWPYLTARFYRRWSAPSP